MNSPHRRLLLLLVLLPTTLHAAVAHQDPIAPVILGVTVILIFALIGRYGARRFGQPSVLGELVMGVLLGNLLYHSGADFILVLREGAAIQEMMTLALASGDWRSAAHEVIGDAATAEALIEVLNGPHGSELLQMAQAIDLFSRYGVILLLFLVGLESSREEMSRTGSASLRVAAVGMVVPFALGFAVAWLILPDNDINAMLFIAATLGATSVGITARVLRDMGRQRSKEAHVILGAAIFDDVLGLVTLAIVTGIVVSGSFLFWNIFQVVLLSALFLVGAFYLGPPLLHRAIYLLRHLDLFEAKLFVSFLFLMLLSWLANLAGLATIIGAFAAGLILDDRLFHHWGDNDKHARSVHDLASPLEGILVPIFFMVIGMQVKLESFLDGEVLLLALGLLVAAILGKLACALVTGPGINRLAVGIGMMPRGEVGLIFASIGKSLGVLNDQLFSAIVLMVIITTLITPSLLKQALLRAPAQESDSRVAAISPRKLS